MPIAARVADSSGARGAGDAVMVPLAFPFKFLPDVLTGRRLVSPGVHVMAYRRGRYLIPVRRYLYL